MEATTRNAMKSIEELDRGLAFLNNEVEELKKWEKDCTALRQEVLYIFFFFFFFFLFESCIYLFTRK